MIKASDNVDQVANRGIFPIGTLFFILRRLL
jgi:hypothetical protein